MIAIPVLRFLSVGFMFLMAVGFVGNAAANDEIWNKLKQGGKVVLIRHAATQQGSEAGNPLVRDLGCKKERNLSAKGRQDAKLLGKRFRERNIPVAEVRHSPYCRTTDTAGLAFGKVIPAKYLSLLEVLGADAAEEQTAQLGQVIGSHSGKGNLILVTHAPNIGAISFELLSFADFVVFQPKGGDEFEELGIVKFTE